MLHHGYDLAAFELFFKPYSSLIWPVLTRMFQVMQLFISTN